LSRVYVESRQGQPRWNGQSRAQNKFPEAIVAVVHSADLKEQIIKQGVVPIIMTT